MTGCDTSPILLLTDCSSGRMKETSQKPLQQSRQEMMVAWTEMIAAERKVRISTKMGDIIDWRQTAEKDGIIKRDFQVSL